MKILKEHAQVPGTRYKNRLILNGFCGGVLNEMDLHEAKDDLGRNCMKFRGKFQEAEAINKNKRIYPYDVLDTNVRKLDEILKNGGLIGELDHPTDSIIHFKESSHKVTKLWWEGKTLMGEGVILSTPCGKILQALINDGVRIGISSRGVGSGKVNEDGVLVIGEGYKLITFDAVADPSTNAAFQERVVHSKKEHTSSSIPPKRTESRIKNEEQGIYKNKELLLACLGGIIRKHTGEISKARLS